MSGKKAHVVRRGPLLYWLSASSAALLLFEFMSGIILWFVLPSGQGWRFSSTATVLGLDRHTWIDLHDWAALVLTAVVVVHIVMHWKWILRQTRAYLSSARRVPDVRKTPGDTA
jgi:quinol-cytochrome oxidoreductase complex cytochrome b subunit